MNLTLGNQPLAQHSKINDVKVNIYPIDQHTVAKSDTYVINKSPEYRLGIHDIVSISVWGHPEFSLSTSGTNGNDILINNKISTTNKIDSTLDISRTKENRPDSYIIDGTGSIYLPLINKIQIAGLTLTEARAKLEHDLKDYIINPNINIRILGFRSQKIYVMGEVQQSQMLSLTDLPLSLPAALETVGWINYITANVNQIYVLRKGDNCVNAFWLDAKSVPAMLYAQSFYLKNDDIVYVSTAGLAQFNRVMTQLLPITQTIWYTKGSIPASAFPTLVN